MKVVNEEKPVVTNAEVKLPNGFTRVYNKIDGSTVDVHTVDAVDYANKLPHLWSLTPIAKEQAKAEDAVIVPEPTKEVKPEPVKEDIRPISLDEGELKSNTDVAVEPAPVVEEKPVSARSRKLAKLD